MLGACQREMEIMMFPEGFCFCERNGLLFQGRPTIPNHVMTDQKLLDMIKAIDLNDFQASH